MGTGEIIIALSKTFLVILPGYILRKRNIINASHTEGLSALITHVTYPCLVISAMQIDFSVEILNNCKAVVLIFMGVIFCAMLMSKILVKFMNLPKEKEGILSFMLVFGNTGFIGLPVLNGVFGSEAVFYGALCDALYDIFMFTVGLSLIQKSSNSQGAGGESQGRATKFIKGLANPCTIGTMIGLSLFLLGITIPDILAGPVKNIGGMTSPLAMIVVGAHFGDIKIKGLFTDKYVYIVCLLKLLVAPAIAIALAYFFLDMSSLMATVLVVQASMPVAMCTVIFAEQCKADVGFATKGVLLTTLCSALTLPINILILQALSNY